MGALSPKQDGNICPFSREGCRHSSWEDQALHDLQERRLPSMIFWIIKSLNDLPSWAAIKKCDPCQKVTGFYPFFSQDHRFSAS